jgi:hypothetical protein
VILTDKLRDAIRRINRDEDGNPYLDDVTIDRAIRELLTTTEFGVFDKNGELTDNRHESKDSTSTQTQPNTFPFLRA